MAATGRPSNAFTRVSTPEVGGVALSPRHALAKEAERLTSLCTRMGRRLNRWLVEHPDVVPSAEYVETFRYYQSATLGLLKEQRERAKMVVTEELEHARLRVMRHKAGMATLTDEEYESEMRTLALESVREMSDDDFAAEMKRRAIDTTSVDS